jgi:hypothetical protein
MFDGQRGEELAKAGLELAIETAEAEHPDWKSQVWQLFWQWLNRKPKYFEFMVEDFREYLLTYDLKLQPKSDRAFGFISKRALKEGLVMHGGLRKVRNKKAHATPANVWIKK